MIGQRAKQAGNPQHLTSLVGNRTAQIGGHPRTPDPYRPASDCARSRLHLRRRSAASLASGSPVVLVQKGEIAYSKRGPTLAFEFAFGSGARKPGQPFSLTGFVMHIQRVEGTCAQFVSAVFPRRSALRPLARLRLGSPFARQRCPVCSAIKSLPCSEGCCSLCFPFFVASLVLPSTHVTRLVADANASSVSLHTGVLNPPVLTLLS